ncbi:hypothetical protein D9613_009011 [Agrocybe pediades]|uniref:BTB domain-containing protein n=1 Tax=Agrocybe pediades TaxID=84607 RepID=A0A8H4VU40_9AGAR|nr:hypothetical protein D9613_009011 [Agrocybe pediades]
MQFTGGSVTSYFIRHLFMSAPSKTLLCTPASVLSPYHVLADAFPKYHPAFCDTDADIVLRSIESTLYRVHSFTLRNTSGFFDTMFGLPQPNGSTRPQSTTLLDVYEGDFELERLLRLMFGLTIPRWSSLEELERVLNIAEKWDTPGPISVIRRALSSGTFIHSHPLKCYLIATHFGWVDVARLASTFTLALNLYDPMHSSTLNELTSKALLPLLELHRRRRDMFKELLNSPERFAAGNSSSKLLI